MNDEETGTLHTASLCIDALFCAIFVGFSLISLHTRAVTSASPGLIRKFWCFQHADCPADQEGLPEPMHPRLRLHGGLLGCRRHK